MKLNRISIKVFTNILLRFRENFEKILEVSGYILQKYFLGLPRRISRKFYAIGTETELHTSNPSVSLLNPSLPLLNPNTPLVLRGAPGSGISPVISNIF